MVLDLDETLVHASVTMLERACDFRCHGYLVYLRPSLHHVLDGLRNGFDVAVWTSSGEDYAKCVVDKAFPEGYPLQFVWSSERCTLHFDPETQQRHWLKNLHKLRRRGADLRRVLCVDDSPEKHLRNYGNLIRVPEYRGELEDNTLPRLLSYIGTLADVPDVRRIEKRAWNV